MMPVKICGMTNEEDILTCSHLGAQALGLVVEYPLPVPWNLTAEQAKDLRQVIPANVTACMVTGGKPEEIIARAKQVRPQMVQLHFEETLEETAYIAKALAPEHIAVIKALRVGPEGRLLFEITDPVEAARLISQTSVAALLVDSGTAKRPGGSGLVVDQAIYRAIAGAGSLPVILAGGLTAQNLHEIIPTDLPPSAVDVLSGVEAGPGRKDKEKVSAFLYGAKSLPKRSGKLWINP
ncbi:MAG: phosphoribosylanthranilate isomerase [Clostridiales bacterium]